MTTPYRVPEELLTARFVLRRVRPDDAGAVFRGWASDAGVTRYLNWLPGDDIGPTRAFIASARAEWDAGTGFPMVVAPRDDAGTLIGMFHPRLAGATVNYGYVLRRDWWNRGVGSEILRRLVDHALGDPAIARAEATCDPGNLASARVMEKAGMTYEGVLRRDTVRPALSHEPRDSLVYAKLR